MLRLLNDLINGYGDEWHDMTIGDIAVAALAVINEWPVEYRMEAMAMHPIALDTSEPLRGGLTVHGKLPEGGFGTVHFKEPAVVVWLPNPTEES